MHIANWGYLAVAIVAVTAFMTANRTWGKWLFGIVILSALLLATNKMVNVVAPKVGGN